MPIAVSSKPSSSTIYGWDCSHYDGSLTKADLVRAVAEGIAFYTHKLGEGLGAEDATQGTALAAARDAGILVLGGYWFLHGNLDPVAEAHACVAMADRDEPWWRDFPGWVWQADAETSGTGLPSPAHVKAFADALERLTKRTVLVYASHGMYGDSLKGLGHPLWNANYGSNKQGPFKSLYPGDNSAGWRPYSGQTPAILQYGSGATIASHTTCDVNAFRGSINDLLTLIGAKPTVSAPLEDDMLDPTPAQLDAMAAHFWQFKPGWAGLRDETPLGMLNDSAAGVDAVKATLASLPAQVVAKLPKPSTPGGTVTMTHDQMVDAVNDAFAEAFPATPAVK